MTNMGITEERVRELIREELLAAIPCTCPRTDLWAGRDDNCPYHGSGLRLLVSRPSREWRVTDHGPSA